MSQSFKKADFGKRFAAWILDNLMILVLVVACCVSLSHFVGYEAQRQAVDNCFIQYETEYGVSFDLTQEEYLALSAAEQQNYDAAYEALSKDPEALQGYGRLMWLSLLIAAVGFLLPMLIWEFLIPLWLGGGQTPGKKVFSLAVVQKDFRDIGPMQLVLRTIVGKYLIETMFPLAILLMVFFGALSISTALLPAALGLVQLACILLNQNRAAIHGLISGTVVVDKSSLVILAE